MNNIKEMSVKIKQMKSKDEIYNFLLEILTTSEVETLSKRWRILKMLKKGKTQREISKDLNVSLCKVTRGSKILKNQKSIVSKIL